MEQENPTYYAIIPANVRYDNDLTDREKLLYGEITALTQKTGECWASNEYFADLYGITTRSIRTSISHLVKRGYLERKLFYKKDSKEVEKRVLTLGKNSSLPLGKICQGGEEKFFPDNNTSINNININNKEKETSSELLEEKFEEFWKLYPRKISKAKAKVSFARALKKTSSCLIFEGLNNYLFEIKDRKTEEQYIAHPATWLNQERWNDEYQRRISDSSSSGSQAKPQDNYSYSDIEMLAMNLSDAIEKKIQRRCYEFPKEAVQVFKEGMSIDEFINKYTKEQLEEMVSKAEEKARLSRFE